MSYEYTSVSFGDEEEDEFYDKTVSEMQCLSYLKLLARRANWTINSKSTALKNSPSMLSIADLVCWNLIITEIYP